MKTQAEMIREIDVKLHDIINVSGAPEQVCKLADEAHGVVHDLAILLADGPSA
jgi:hypothetical protein